MTRSITTLSALACALLVTACTSVEERREASLPAEQRHPIEVTTQVQALDVQTDSYGGLTDRSRAEVSRFLHDFRTDGAGSVEVHVASASYGRAEAEIQDLAYIQGIPGNRVVLRSFVPPPGSRAQVRVAFARYVAGVPSCVGDDWRENIGLTWDNTPYPSFGCATQINAAAQIADPRDVLEARAMTPSSADRRATIIDKYEKGEPTHAKGEESTVSDSVK